VHSTGDALQTSESILAHASSLAVRMHLLQPAYATASTSIPDLVMIDQGVARLSCAQPQQRCAVNTSGVQGSQLGFAP
jgi:hypothetical protein